MLYPMYSQVTTFPIAGRIHVAPNGFGKLVWNQLSSCPSRPNCVPYMNPHSSAPTTAGTAYGRNTPIRYNADQCNRALSIASATANARINMIGTCTTRKSETRSNPSQNCASLNACV